MTTSMHDDAATAKSLATLVKQRSIIVCCGSGGVGKTTIAAAIALEGARLGRRTCVVTIDPARRLADALGLDSLSNAPHLIEGSWPGELWAMMLDPKGTFDDLVLRYAGDQDQARGIYANRLYRNLTEALSGTQEYMAMEKLYELNEEGHFDLIVVDTPPTRNALDFIDAPRRLTRFLDNRIFRLLMMPTRVYLRAVSIATRTLLKTISKVVGSDAVNDTVDFFRAFEGMEEGFRNRASNVLDLLSEPSTAFVVVASPRSDALDEATFFAEKLEESDIEVQALVVNRLHPRFSVGEVTDGNRSRDGISGDRGHAASSGGDRRLAVLRSNLADFARVADREETHFSTLAASVAPAPVARVPILPADVHDIEGLSSVAKLLFGDRGKGQAL